MTTMTFQRALEISRNGPRSVLLGNGFSIAQSGENFSYKTLLDKSGLDANSSVRKTFNALKTFDFELVIKALNAAAEVATAYNAREYANQLKEDSKLVREALIHAVKEVHPVGHFELPAQQRGACGNFLKCFDLIFTMNYDLLLYWVFLDATKHKDGFGLGETVAGFRTFRIGALCSAFYLHGALHLFLDDSRETQKQIRSATTILEEITRTIRGGRLPLFVAEGSAIQKLARINSVPYLKHCYDTLSKIGGNLFIYGHSISENDSHIYDAICRSGLKKIFCCVHRPDETLASTRELLAKYSERRKDISFFYVDSATANVWG